MRSKPENISVIGDGSWGTTLAIYLARNGHAVTLWGAFAENIRLIKKTGYNAKFLPGIRVPKTVTLTSDLACAIETADTVTLAVPSKYIVKILSQLKRLDFSRKTVLSVIKGIETFSYLRMSQIIARELHHDCVAVLSGPTIAVEVAKGIPSSAVIAARDHRVAEELQKIFNSDTFRIYTNTDVVGLELGGSLKNVIAIACGVCDGLGYGTNTKAAILTRGLVEMSRLGKAMGAEPKTFSGLAGLGDLVTTCFSPKSRNRFVGEHLGKGSSIRKITSSMNMVAEGVETVKAIHHMSEKYKVSMPISDEVHNIIYKRKNPLKAVSDLMSRKARSE